jgi:methyl-accepting chemotaxis protein
MSGSNAIAAAKRRRGGTEVAKPGQLQNQSQTNSQGPPSQIHPLQLVMINHERLNKISNDFSQFPQALDSLGENFNSLSSNCDFLHEKLQGLDEKLTSLNLNNSDVSSKSVNIELGNRLDSVETRVNDLFKQFATIQSYMLELTLSVNNLKENIRQMSTQTQVSYVTPTVQTQTSVTNEVNEDDQSVSDVLLTKEDLQSINYVV